MLFQQQILREEYEAFGVVQEPAPAGIVRKEQDEYAEADYIAVPSSFVGRTFVERGVARQKLIEIPLGVDLSRFHPAAKEDNVFRIIHCGALSLRKGVHYLLQAFSEMRLKNAELWLIGAMTDEIRPFLRRFAHPSIHLKGVHPQRELYKLYAQGSIFCLASIEEGMAMVIPQAMACGLPVVCTTNTGGGDIVRDGIDGFVIPIRDVDALKTKVGVLYENRSLREDLGRSARLRVQSGFSWGDYGHKAAEAYGRILKLKATNAACATAT